MQRAVFWFSVDVCLTLADWAEAVRRGFVRCAEFLMKRDMPPMNPWTNRPDTSTQPFRPPLDDEPTRPHPRYDFHGY
jgi:hypothetical protein